MTAPSDLISQLRIDRDRQPAPPKSAGHWRWIAPTVLVLGALALFLFTREPAREVRVATAELLTAESGGSSATSVLDASGYVTARRIATVSSKITGKVVEVLIEEGQVVREGEVVARLEATDAIAQRELSAAQLAAARSEVTRAEAQLRLAEQTLARTSELAGRQLVAQSALDQARAERDALAAQLEAARRNVQVASEALDLAEIGVDNTVVRAPFDGVVTVKAAQPGEMISPISAGGGFTRTGIGTIVDLDSLEIQVDVNEASIGRVRAGQKVEAVLNAYPDWKIPAEVIAIVPTADRSKATVKVRIAFLERDPRIVPDMGVRVSFLEESPAAADGKPVVLGVTVPAEAVTSRDGRTVAFVVKDERVQLRQIESGEARDGRRRVSRGLAAGERVVLSPPAELADGDAVTVIE
jgi:RND family efflux transporter MFP subunit